MELLSPVGDFECLKAAVQNGADCVYFGSDLFSARASANNFSGEELKKAIEYAKLRGVKTNLTLNILIKDDEFDDALNLARKAYCYGIDAIIVQDLGLAMKLIKEIPDLPIHASTQMTVYSLNGALQLQNMGFKRVVLARELSSIEIEYICKNTDVEIECFVHGALCVSYSGQCLFSSMIGGRSGNRGRCAGPCRLPYELYEDDKKINQGYLLSTRDLCGLDYIPFFVKAGVSCLKIEGRMKSPEYVSIVTGVYRKYIDLAISGKASGKEFKVDPADQKMLLQAFNRGMSSTGHLNNEPNRNLVFKNSPGNMGLPLGKVQNYNKNKGLITVKLKEKIQIGDTISLQNEKGTYTISELMENKRNITETRPDQVVTIGRMKGNINVADNIYKISSKELSTSAKNSYGKEFKKVAMNANVVIKRNTPISIEVTSYNSSPIYKDLHVTATIDEVPVEAKNRPLTKEMIVNQLDKTSSTPYFFKTINVDLDDGLFLPKLSTLNELRRNVLAKVEDYAISMIHRDLPNVDSSVKDVSTLDKMRDNVKNNSEITTIMKPKVSILLNNLNVGFHYSKLADVDNIYIPLKYFASKKYENILNVLNKNADLYVYMPTIIKGNYKNLFYNNARSSVEKYDIKGFVTSNICNIRLLNELFDDLDKNYKLVSNYTLNVFNLHTVLELKKLGISTFTLSPELDKPSIQNLCNYSYLNKELIVYGRTPLLNMNYCLLGETNKCYPECKAKCTSSHHYSLKDRIGLSFPVVSDNIQTVSTLYNSKITSISPKDYNVNSVRLDFLDESIDEINDIISVVRNGDRLEGKLYTGDRGTLL